MHLKAEDSYRFHQSHLLAEIDKYLECECVCECVYLCVFIRVCACARMYDYHIAVSLRHNDDEQLYYPMQGTLAAYAWEGNSCSR